jgi:hypothetical protein
LDRTLCTPVRRYECAKLAALARLSTLSLTKPLQSRLKAASFARPYLRTSVLRVRSKAAPLAHENPMLCCRLFCFIVHPKFFCPPSNLSRTVPRTERILSNLSRTVPRTAQGVFAHPQISRGPYPVRRSVVFCPLSNLSRTVPRTERRLSNLSRTVRRTAKRVFAHPQISRGPYAVRTTVLVHPLADRTTYGAQSALTPC